VLLCTEAHRLLRVSVAAVDEGFVGVGVDDNDDSTNAPRDAVREFEDIVDEQLVQVKRRKISARRQQSSSPWDCHDETCHVCRRDGELLCCDSCNLVFHVSCVRPSLQAVPEGKWSCAYCKIDAGDEQEGEGVAPETRCGRFGFGCSSRVAIFDMMRLSKLIALAPMAEDAAGKNLSAELTLRFDPAMDVVAVTKTPSRYVLKQQPPPGGTASSSSGDSESLVHSGNERYLSVEEAMFAGLCLQEQLEEQVRAAVEEEQETLARKKRKKGRGGSDDEGGALDDTGGVEDSFDTGPGRSRAERRKRKTSLTSDVYDLTTSASKRRGEAKEREKESRPPRTSDEEGVANERPWCAYCLDDKLSELCVFCGCRVCHGKHNTDYLIICDGCDEEVHTYCVRPPLTSIPRGAWYCQRCTSAGKGCKDVDLDGKKVGGTSPKSTQGAAGALPLSKTTADPFAPIIPSMAPVLPPSIAPGSAAAAAAQPVPVVPSVALPVGVLVTAEAVLRVIAKQTRLAKALPDYKEGEGTTTGATGAQVCGWNAQDLKLLSLFRQFAHASDLKAVIAAMEDHRRILQSKLPPPPAPLVVVKPEAGVDTGKGKERSPSKAAQRALAQAQAQAGGDNSTPVQGRLGVAGRGAAKNKFSLAPGKNIASFYAPLIGGNTSSAGAGGALYSGGGAPRHGEYAAGAQQMVLPSPPGTHAIPSTINHKGNYYYSTQVPPQVQQQQQKQQQQGQGQPLLLLQSKGLMQMPNSPLPSLPLSRTSPQQPAQTQTQTQGQGRQLPSYPYGNTQGQARAHVQPGGLAQSSSSVSLASLGGGNVTASPVRANPNPNSGPVSSSSGPLLLSGTLTSAKDNSSGYVGAGMSPNGNMKLSSISSIPGTNANTVTTTRRPTGDFS